MYRKIIHRLTPAPDFQYAYEGINFAAYIYTKSPAPASRKIYSWMRATYCVQHVADSVLRAVDNHFLGPLINSDKHRYGFTTKDTKNFKEE